MYDRIDLTTTPGRDHIIASTVLDYDDVFTGDVENGGGEFFLFSSEPKEAPEVGHEPSAWPEGHFETAGEPDDDEDDDTDDDDDFGDEDADDEDADDEGTEDGDPEEP